MKTLKLLNILAFLAMLTFALSGCAQATPAPTDTPPPPPTATPKPTEAPTPTPSPAEPTAVPELKAAAEGESANIEFTYPGHMADYNAFQIFLDTDQNVKTGYQIGGIGAEFLVEGSTLNKYTGTGKDWSWEELAKDIIYFNQDPVASWNISLAQIGSPAAFDFVGQTVDKQWNSAYISRKATFNP